MYCIQANKLTKMDQRQKKSLPDPSNSMYELDVRNVQ